MSESVITRNHALEELLEDLAELEQMPFEATCCNSGFPIDMLRRVCRQAIASLAPARIPEFVTIDAMVAYESALNEDPMGSDTGPAKFLAMSKALEAAKLVLTDSNGFLLDNTSHEGLMPGPAVNECEDADVSWQAATQIACVDDVDEALRDFSDDPTGDNGTILVREVMRAVKKSQS